MDGEARQQVAGSVVQQVTLRPRFSAMHVIFGRRARQRAREIGSVPECGGGSRTRASIIIVFLGGVDTRVTWTLDSWGSWASAERGIVRAQRTPRRTSSSLPAERACSNNAECPCLFLRHMFSKVTASMMVSFVPCDRESYGDVVDTGGV